jgi:hypothetical protein
MHERGQSEVTFETFLKSLERDLPEGVNLVRSEKDSNVEADLTALIPSPTSDPARRVEFWSENGEPSVAFGGWHTHLDLFGEDDSSAAVEMTSLVLRILRDRVVYLSERPHIIVDLDDPLDVLDTLTSPHLPSTLTFVTWSGRDIDASTAANANGGA